MGDMNSSLAYSVAFHSIILTCGVHLRLSHVVEVVDNARGEPDGGTESLGTGRSPGPRSEIRDAGSRIRVAR